MFNQCCLLFYISCQSFQPSTAPIPIQPPLSTWTPIPPSVNQLVASAGGIGFGIQANPGSFHISYCAFWIMINH